MQILVKGNEFILKMLSSYNNVDRKYRVSNFILLYDVDDGTLIQNTLTGELLLVSCNENALLKQVELDYSEDIAQLIRHHILVPERRDEVKVVNQLRAVILKCLKNRGVINHYNILPTTGCNARCFYCYQSDMPHMTMSKETASRLVDFIIAHHGGERVRLSWFGGEPTLGINRINQICRELDSAGVKYESDMVSNGYLFDDELVNVAKNVWNLRSIQITIDGTEQTYIAIKNYIGITDNPYTRVLQNIESFLNHNIEVNLRLNFDMHNVQDLQRLINELENRFAGRENLHIYVWQLDEEVGYVPIRHTEYERKQLDQQYAELQNILESKGWPQVWRKELPMLSYRSCMADDPYVVQCAPNGILSKCEDKIFKHTIGNLQEGITSQSEIRWWQERTILEGCGTCPLYPSCNRLLKNCPTRKERCMNTFKSRRIDKCYELMRDIYRAHKDTCRIKDNL